MAVGRRDRYAPIPRLLLNLLGSLGSLIASQQPLRAQAVTPVNAVAAIPVRRLAAPHAVSSDTLGPRIVARGLSNGSVLVGVFAFGQTNDKRRVKLFDSTLQNVTLVMDSSKMPQLVRFTGDSTVALDQPSQSLLVLDQGGAVARVMALPRVQDFDFLVGFARTPAIDPAGRLIYRAAAPPIPFTPPDGKTARVPQPDSAPIVRVDFETRRIDTLARVYTGHATEGWITQNTGERHTRIVANPIVANDEWAMLADGTIAVVRASDYHIDWVDPDGTRRSTPRMSFNWRRLTTADKQRMIDSLMPTVDTAQANQKPRTIQRPDGPLKLSWTIDVLPLDQMPEYEPAVTAGSVRADLDGNLWIVPRIAASAQEGLLYDVVNRKGEIIERVQFPKGRVLAGFGPGGIAYLNRVEGKVGFLERVKIRD